MSRSLKKGPYIDYKLERKVFAMNDSGKKAVIKTWARASMISPEFVGHTIAVHNGNKFIPVYITETWLVINWENLRRPGPSAVTEAARIVNGLLVL